MSSNGPTSYYAATVGPRRPHSPLAGTARADICVIGAGYTGLSAALHAALSGARVIVLESQSVGFAASGRNGGQIHSGHRWDQIELEKWLGKNHAHELWSIAEDAKSLVRELAAAHAPECELKSGLLIAAHDEHALRALDVETTHLQRHYAYPNARTLSADEVAAAVGSPIYKGGRLDTGGGHLHPLKYALGLADAAVAAGAVIHEGADVHEIAARPNGIAVRTRSGCVEVDKAILACDAFSGTLLPELDAYIGHVESFVTATEPLGPALDAAILPSNWAVADTRHVLDYYRKSSDGRLLFAGRESYWNPPKDIAALVRTRMLRVFPALKNTRTDFAWSGTVGITRTRMPHFGRSGDRLLFGYGYSGHGVALATMGGKLLAEAALGRSEGFDVLASVPPSRFPGPAWTRKPLITAALLWYKLQDAL